jgi:HAE1 family hydrophobic/amphiphilic exporter-1
VKQLIEFSVHRAVTVFMAVLIVIVFGVVSLTNLTTDLFPSINVPFAVVLTPYPGASPTEVEDVVTNSLEETLATTTNIKEFQSISQENVSIIILEFNSDTNMDSAVIEMRENLDLTTSGLPDGVGNPTIIKLNPDLLPVMQLSVTKEGLTQQELTNYVEQEVLPRIERIPGVASVSVSGAYESEIQVTIDEAAIAAINDQLRLLFAGAGVDEEDMPLLDRDMISDILMAQNFEFPVGFANVDGIGYLVRVGDEFESLEDIKNLLVFNFSGIDGVAPPLSFTVDDIADVAFVNANDKEYSKVNGENAISFSIQKNSEFATTDVTNEIAAVLAELSDADDTLEFTVLLNQGDYINQSIGSVTSNLLFGALLAVIVLLVFLRSARATTIVALAIPISVMFALVLIYFTGITLNIVSMGGLALGIGMLVDNSIVVIENIYRFRREGKSRKEAALEGTKQVAGAITASTITTISVFLPVLFIEGFIREIFLQMALTIAYSLTASLLIALTLVPAISSKILKETQSDQVDEKDAWYHDVYERVLKFAQRNKIAFLIGALILFAGSILLALTNGLTYFPESDEGQMTISISNPADAPLSFDDFVATLDSISSDLLDHPDVEVVGISLGSMQGMMFGIGSENNASANVVLRADRDKTTREVEQEFQILLARDYPTIEFDISGSQQQIDALTGSGIQIRLQGYDLETLAEQANRIADILASVDGIAAVDNGIGVPAQEIKITVDKDKAIEYGFTTAQVLATVAGLIAEEELTTTLTVGSDIYEVYVYDSESNTGDTTYTLEQIENLVLGLNFLNPLEVVRVRDVATVLPKEGFRSVIHVDGIRTITIDGEYADDANPTFVARDVEDALADLDMPEGYEFEILGENEEVMEAINTMVLAISLGILLIYMVLASQFQSLSYPFIIMTTIPLAFTGGFLILFFAGMPVSVVAAVGFVVLVGVVVNNGIVLVDYINQLREQGHDMDEAILLAGKTRLRPIIMTALTTILALVTLALGFGDGAEIIQPMAITTIGGLLYATILTLLLVPIMYELLTHHGRGIFTVLGIVVVVAATVILRLLFGFWYIIPAGVIALGLIVGSWFLLGKGETQRV